MRSKLCCGSWAVGLAALLAGCQFPAPPNKDLPPDATRVCEPASHVCTDGVATLCSDDGTSSTTETCTFGCAVSGDRCADLDPSNGLAAQLDLAGNREALVLRNGAVINTETGMITDGDGTVLVLATTMIDADPVDVMALPVRSLTVGDVTVRGTRALAILVDEDVAIAGVFSVSADRGEQGPGSLSDRPGCVGGAYRECPDFASFSGAGGGGFGSDGGAGGPCDGASFAPMGRAEGNPQLVPLRGGCRGGGGGQNSAAGAGGGALQISARGAIRLGPGAFIAANGGGGWGPPTNPTCSPFLTLGGLPCENGSGGGAGGGILLEAATVELDTGAGLTANGGSGHYGVLATAASPGLLSTEPSPAFVPGCAGCPSGGRGAARGVDATHGASGYNGSGGGGGVGRIRINLAAGSVPALGSAVLSPAPSIGPVTTR
jgi:hypothetical protein